VREKIVGEGDTGKREREDNTLTNKRQYLIVIRAYNCFDLDDLSAVHRLSRSK
jgi:hypothetical protein